MLSHLLVIVEFDPVKVEAERIKKENEAYIYKMCHINQAKIKLVDTIIL
jgi:hypothetical protein